MNKEITSCRSRIYWNLVKKNQYFEFETTIHRPLRAFVHCKSLKSGLLLGEKKIRPDLDSTYKIYDLNYLIDTPVTVVTLVCKSSYPERISTVSKLLNR